MLMRFDPFADFDRVTRRVLNDNRASFYMPVDAYKHDDKFFLHIDLPGVDPESIDIEVENTTLTVRAERSWSLDESTNVLMRERPQGSFSRQFFLGEGLDTDRIEAGYDHGVLTITIPMAEQAKPRKIVVGASDRALTS